MLELSGYTSCVAPSVNSILINGMGGYYDRVLLSRTAHPLMRPTRDATGVKANKRSAGTFKAF